MASDETTATSPPPPAIETPVESVAPEPLRQAEVPDEPASDEPVAPDDPELSSKTAEPDPDWAPTQNPNATVVPGQMRSDHEEIPAGFTKEQADQAEIAEARAARSRAVAACQYYWPSPHAVCGAIKDKYNSLGGPASFLSYPNTPELTNPDGHGKRTQFLNGPIYWSAATGAHPVVNSFLNRWGVHGYEAGWLGYPKTDEIVHADGVGRRQEFQGGAIYVAFQNAIGSTITGAIRDKWNTVGAETPGSLLGYPTSDEIRLPDGQGRMNRFERGVIYWHPSYGAWPVTGGVLERWASAGYESGPHGYPTADAVDNGSTIEQRFQHGTIHGPGGATLRLAELSPGVTAMEILTEAERVAQEVSAGVVDVIQDILSGALLDMSVDDVSEPNGAEAVLPDARGPGDLFLSDATTLDVNHGHNGIFVSTTQTVEALDPERGVQLINNPTAGPGQTPRTLPDPKMMWVNTSSTVRAAAVSFARFQEGKGYNSNFHFNKKVVDAPAYNCSSLLWAAYMTATEGGIDLDEINGEEEHTPSAIYPREIYRSSWTTPYP
ncbi:hypothetical protein [Rhodococcus sp. NPDC058521]|uniref:hypothetical protein n=1 Tax=Rhodococcus sp. NPDC058521 TaxID=3346536 RepID=UPI00364905AC